MKPIITPAMQKTDDTKRLRELEVQMKNFKKLNPERWRFVEGILQSASADESIDRQYECEFEKQFKK